MNNQNKNSVVYKRQADDGLVVVEGKTYCVKTEWTPVEGAKTFAAYAVAEGEELCEGMFPAVKVEAFACGDGSWDVIGVEGPELVDETGGGYGDLAWSEEMGVVTR